MFRNVVFAAFAKFNIQERSLTAAARYSYCLALCLHLLIKCARFSDVIFDCTETLVYATGGRELLMEAVLVDIVSKVVTPRATLAGTA